MSELLRQPGRTSAQSRITRNRDGILPSRRALGTPESVLGSDMRQAVRGDGGADDLRRALGMFPGSFSQAAEAFVAGDPEKNRELAAQGELDAAAGVGPASDRAPYQDSYFTIRADNLAAEARRNIDAKVTEAINSGASPEEVDAIVNREVQSYIETVRRDIPNAAGQSRFARNITGFIGERGARASEEIRERTTNEAVTGWTTSFVARLDDSREAGTPVFDFDAEMAILTPIVGAEEAGDMIVRIVAVEFSSYDKADPGAIRGILESRPDLTPQQREVLQQALTQAEAAAEAADERVAEARRDLIYNDIYSAAARGEQFDMTRIDQALANEWITGEEAATMRRFAASTYDLVQTGVGNETEFVEAITNLALTQRTIPQLREYRDQLIKDHETGRFGTGNAGRRLFLQAFEKVTAEIQQRETQEEAERRERAREARQNAAARAAEDREAGRRAASDRRASQAAADAAREDARRTWTAAGTDLARQAGMSVNQIGNFQDLMTASSDPRATYNQWLRDNGLSEAADAPRPRSGSRSGPPLPGRTPAGSSTIRPPVNPPPGSMQTDSSGNVIREF